MESDTEGPTPLPTGLVVKERLGRRRLSAAEQPVSTVPASGRHCQNLPRLTVPAEGVETEMQRACYSGIDALSGKPGGGPEAGLALSEETTRTASARRAMLPIEGGE